MGSRAVANIIGHVTADPKCDEYEPGKLRARFRIAVNRFVRGEKHADFFQCVAFGRTAEIIRDNITSGRLVSVDCEPQLYRDADKKEWWTWFVKLLTFLDQKPGPKTGASVAYHESTDPYDPGGDDAPF